MLVVEVLLGEQKDFGQAPQQRLTRPPQKTLSAESTPLFFDSVKGGPFSPPGFPDCQSVVHAVFDSTYCCPLYMLSYTLKLQ